MSVRGRRTTSPRLLAHDLVDEIHLMAFPVILGHGRTLWAPTPDKTAWRLTTARS